MPQPVVLLQHLYEHTSMRHNEAGPVAVLNGVLCYASVYRSFHVASLAPICYGHGNDRLFGTGYFYPPPVPANSPDHTGTEGSAARRLRQYDAPSSLHSGTAISLPIPSPMRTMSCKKDTICRRMPLQGSSRERTSAAASASPLSHRSRNSAYKDTCSSSCCPLWCQDHQGT